MGDNQSRFTEKDAIAAFEKYDAYKKANIKEEIEITKIHTHAFVRLILGHINHMTQCEENEEIRKQDIQHICIVDDDGTQIELQICEIIDCNMVIYTHPNVVNLIKTLLNMNVRYGGNYSIIYSYTSIRREITIRKGELMDLLKPDFDEDNLWHKYYKQIVEKNDYNQTVLIENEARMVYLEQHLAGALDKIIVLTEMVDDLQNKK